MQKSRIGKALFVCLCAMLLLAGCGGGTQTGPAKQGEASDKPKEKLTVMLDWYPNAVHSFLYTAMKKGYFAEEGIDLDIQMPAETNDPLRMAAANKIDLAFTYQPAVAIARSEGVPVKSIATVVRHPLNVVLVPKNSPIHSPKDFAGKKIGYPSMPLDEVNIQTMMEKDGADFKQAKMTDIGFDIVSALATNRVDAVIGGYKNHEQLLLDKKGFPVRAINLSDYGVPDSSELVIAASDKTIADKKDVLARFWKAASKGQDYVLNHKQEGLGYLLANEKKEFPLEKDVEEKSLDILLPLMNEQGQPFGAQSADQWTKVVEWLKKNKQVKPDVKPEDCFTALP